MGRLEKWGIENKLIDDIRSRKGGKITPKCFEEYEVVEVLSDGYTYNPKLS